MHNAPRVAGLIYGSDTHYLDHLAPLCALLQVPLIVVDETIYHLAKQFYPDLVIYDENFLALAEKVAANFDILFHCGARPLFDEVFFFTQKMSNKKIHTIWCPHGNSDKGHLTPHMEALDKEEVALVYGQK